MINVLTFAKNLINKPLLIGTLPMEDFELICADNISNQNART